MTRTAIIAGAGALPGLLAAALDPDQTILAEMEGFPADLPGHVPQRFRIERLVPFLDHLSEQGVTRVVFAGAVRRPKLEPELFDPRTAQLVPRLLGAIQAGDDAALREVIAIFEEFDLAVVGAADIAPDLVPGEGVLAGAPSDADRRDADRAAEIVAAIGGVDVGQGAVVAQGLCLGVEALPGTDAMLDFVALTGAALRPDPKGARGVLYKAPKPGQDRRIDLPAIGMQTLHKAVAAGLAGIAWEAGGALLLDRAAMQAEADRLGPVPLGAGQVKLFVIAGEPSGDRLGAALMAGLKTLQPGIEFAGIGGQGMEAEGLHSQFPMEELSVMGLAEILPKYRALKARIAQTAARIVAERPDALITIDSPDFCLRVARLARASLPGLKTIHYVAPTVWAWRPGRAAKMAQVIDHVLALFPFEPDLMRAAGMSCDFVGHPVVAAPRASPEDAAAFRETHMIGPGQPLVLCLPGSRHSEVKRLAPRFDEALMRLRDREPGLRVVLPTVRGVSSLVRTMTARWPHPPIVVEAEPDRLAAFAAADLALAASGTVSLELAASATPMVIAYDMNWLTRIIVGRMLKVDTVTLVNLVSETRAIPEFLGRDCRPGPIARTLADLLENKAARKAQLEAMEITMDRLGRGGEAPGLRAARSVLSVLG